MKKWSLFVVLTLVLLYFIVPYKNNKEAETKADQPKISDQGLAQSATSSITTSTDKEGNIIVKTVNRRFSFTEYLTDNVYTKQQVRTLLFLEEFTQEHKVNEEDAKGIVKVEAWMGKDAKPTDKLWSIEEKGEEGGRVDRFYRVTKMGCCGSEPTNYYFNLATGEKIFSATMPLLKIEVPNAPNQFTRYVTFHSCFASILPPERDKLPDLIGVVQYGAENKPIGRIMVRSSLGDAVGTPKLKLKYQDKTVENETLVLWGAEGKKDPSSLSNFSLVISFGPLGEIIVPVNNDRFEIGKAEVPKKFTIE